MTSQRHSGLMSQRPTGPTAPTNITGLHGKPAAIRHGELAGHEGLAGYDIEDGMQYDSDADGLDAVEMLRCSPINNELDQSRDHVVTRLVEN